MPVNCDMSASVKRVAVIGAGPSGLVTCRHFAARPESFSVTVFEQSATIGGTWVYNDQVGHDEAGLPVFASMYKNLRTNLPKAIMGTPEFPFPPEGKSFLRHTEVLAYIQRYCDHFELQNFIRFHTKVTEVRPLKVESNLVWSVKVENMLTYQNDVYFFDAVAVCNGHFFKPIIPNIPGLDSFKGVVIHSKDYRIPESFKDLRVICLGGGPSGLDIAMELCSLAKEVILSHRFRCKLHTNLPSNFQQLRPIESYGPRGFVFEGGETYTADALIFCTGYDYDFPFLHQDCGVSVTTQRVTPLYKHMFHTTYPTMAFIALPIRVPFIPCAHLQAQLFLKTLDGSVQLPSKEVMDLVTASQLKELILNGLPEEHHHRFGPTITRSYFNEIAELAGVKPLPKAWMDLFEDLFLIRLMMPAGYHKLKFEITEERYVLQQDVDGMFDTIS